MHNFKGAIFDLDGTLLDSMWLWREIDVSFLKKRGIEPDLEYIRAITPLGFKKAVDYTRERYSLTESAESIMQELHLMAFEAYEKEISLKPFAKEYLYKLKKQNIKLGVATALSHNFIEAVLNKNDLSCIFDTITSVNEVERAKAHPDIYLLAAKKMNKKPQDCIVFEDIAIAIKGAKTGGFQTCGVLDEHSEYEWADIKKLSDFYISSFKELL